ncbi:MAG: helix-hairpin-helix domain-containing protein [Romboutsia sp.]
MKKVVNIIIFLFIIVAGIGIIIYKQDVSLEDNIYVVSESEENSNQTISNNQTENEMKVEKDVGEVKEKIITIHISGEVNSPGVVSIEYDKRLFDAVEKLGGLTENADFNKINLAMKIEDEKHYIIPKIGEKLELYNISEENNILNSENENSNKININIATIQELESLPGIGEATANKIVNYRKESGEFKSIEEIKNVNGIGDKKYDSLKDSITIN